MNLRRYFVCPCARCREERREERERIPWPEVQRRLLAAANSERFAAALSRADTEGWRRAIQRQASEYWDDRA